MKRPTVLSLALVSLAAAPLIGAGPAPRPVALVHARVETISDGVVEDATVILRDGKIAEIGKGLAAPAGARVVDVKGGTVMPGIVSPVSRLGLLSGAPRDDGDRGDFRNRGGRGGRGGGGPRPGGGAGDPSLRAIDEVPALEDVYALALGRAGVTSLGLAPFGNGIAGQGSVIRPRGAKRADMSISDSAFLWVSVETETQALGDLKRAFEDAKKEIDARKKAEEERKKKEEEEKKKKEADAKAAAEAAEKAKEGEKKEEPPKPGPTPTPAPGPTPPAKEEPPKGGEAKPPAAAEAKAPAAPKTDPKKEPLIAVIEGRLPLFLACDRASDLLHFLEQMKEIGLESLKFTVVGGSDLDRAADVLKEHGLPVILTPDVTNEPNTRNRLFVARVLHEAGVPIAFSAGSDTLEAHRSLLARAADAVRFGLPRDVALKALTLAPAERLGVAARVGSVAAGKDANLIVTDGDPLDARSRVLSVYLDGVAYDPDFGLPVND